MSDFFYKKLDAYKIAKEYTIYVYSLLRKYPNYEQFALCDQLRRAVVSVPSNLVEGMGRGSQGKNSFPDYILRFYGGSDVPIGYFPIFGLYHRRRIENC